MLRILHGAVRCAAGDGHCSASRSSRFCRVLLGHGHAHAGTLAAPALRPPGLQSQEQACAGPRGNRDAGLCAWLVTARPGIAASKLWGLLSLVSGGPEHFASCSVDGRAETTRPVCMVKWMEWPDHGPPACAAPAG